MLVNLSLSETVNIKGALRDRLEKLKSINIEDNNLKEMIKNTQKALDTINKAEKVEAEKYKEDK